jgi:hypothetical protein
MREVVTMGERKFVVIRKCKSEFMTDELRESIKARNPLIDIVLSDGRGYFLFCHEPKVVEYRDIEPNEKILLSNQEDS